MKKSKLLVYLFLIIIFAALRTSAQTTDSLLNSLNDNKSNHIGSTFKATHIVLSHSTETQKKHDLDFMIRHRFGDIGGEFGGAHTLFGLDIAPDLYIGLDYGITDNFTIGIGRSKHDE